MNYEELIENIGADAALLNTVGYRLDDEDFFNDDIFNELVDELKDEFNGIVKAKDQVRKTKYDNSDKGKERIARQAEKRKAERAEAKALRIKQKQTKDVA